MFVCSVLHVSSRRSLRISTSLLPQHQSIKHNIVCNLLPSPSLFLRFHQLFLFLMATMAYPPLREDGFGFGGIQPSLSRHPSVHSAYGSQQHVAFPYGDHAGMYSDRSMSAGLHGQVGGISLYPSLVIPLTFLTRLTPNRRILMHSLTGEVDTCRVSVRLAIEFLLAFICSPGYDEYAIHDPYYHDERRNSTASLHTPMPHRQRRRSTSVAFDMRAPPMDTFRRLSSTIIKFKRKGAYRSGLTIGDAQANARLTGNDSYTFRDFNADGKGRIALKIRVSLN